MQLVRTPVGRLGSLVRCVAGRSLVASIALAVHADLDVSVLIASASVVDRALVRSRSRLSRVRRLARIGVAVGGVLARTHHGHDAEQCGHAGLVAVGTIGARRYARIHALDAQHQQGQRRHETDSPEHPAHHARDKARHLHDPQRAHDQHQHGR